jgi:type VII secretion-associated serine protease mycosin
MTVKQTLLSKTLALGLVALSLVGCGYTSPELSVSLPSSSNQSYNPRTVNAASRRSTTLPGQLVVKFRQPLSNALVSGFSARYGVRVLKTSSLGAILVQHNPQLSSQQVMQTLKADPVVEYAEPNVTFRTRFVVNDPRSADQKGLGMIGMGKAWDITLGDPRVVIAVVDTGIDMTHPDLRDKLVPGFNVLSPGQPPQDDNGHGTHASGIAAAATDNRTGIAGTAPRCRIMPIKALNSEGGGDGFSVATGVVWAVDNGAHIINLSLGGEAPQETLERAIKYALARNVSVIVAMGNESTNALRYPASYPGVIAVGSVDQTRNLSNFSNYGKWMSVVAPGSQILSTMPMQSVYMTSAEGYMNEYDFMDGTSMAAPMVAGVVALMKSRHPNLTPAEIKARLEGTARDLGAPGFDERFGHGLVDAPRAIL